MTLKPHLGVFVMFCFQVPESKTLKNQWNLKNKKFQGAEKSEKFNWRFSRTIVGMPEAWTPEIWSGECYFSQKDVI